MAPVMRKQKLSRIRGDTVQGTLNVPNYQRQLGMSGKGGSGGKGGGHSGYTGCLGYSDSTLSSTWIFPGNPPACSYTSNTGGGSSGSSGGGGGGGGGGTGGSGGGVSGISRNFYNHRSVL